MPFRRRFRTKTQPFEPAIDGKPTPQRHRRIISAHPLRRARACAT
jgi:hypothetical protein